LLPELASKRKKAGVSRTTKVSGTVMGIAWFALFPVLGWPWRSSLVDDDVEFAAQGPLPQNTRVKEF
jgi:hypothetical protein